MKVSDTNSNRYEGYTPHFDFGIDSGAYFRETKKQGTPKEVAPEIVLPKKQPRKQMGLMEELAELKEEGNRIFNYLKLKWIRIKIYLRLRKSIAPKYQG